MSSIEIEMIGYVGSFFGIISLMFTRIRFLRLFNLLGCILLVIYGALIFAIPVVAMNGTIAIIHCYHLIREKVLLQKDSGAEQIITATTITPIPNGPPDNLALVSTPPTSVNVVNDHEKKVITTNTFSVASSDAYQLPLEAFQVQEQE